MSCDCRNMIYDGLLITNIVCEKLENIFSIYDVVNV